MLKYGDVVEALSGRDQGGLFCVVAIECEYVFIVDGKTRTLEKPKRKNEKHLRSINIQIDATQTTTNKSLRQALRALSKEK